MSKCICATLPHRYDCPMSIDPVPDANAGEVKYLERIRGLQLRAEDAERALALRNTQCECFAHRVQTVCGMVGVKDLNQLHDWILLVLERGRNE